MMMPGTEGTLTREFSARMLDSQVSQVLDRSGGIVRAWIREHLSSAGAPLHSGGAVSLMPSCFAILAAECVGGVLDSIDRDALVKRLREQQDEVTGFFSPGLLRRGELSSYSATYLRLQATYFAIHALDALRAEPQHPVRFAEALCDQSYLRGWLDGGPWSRPWRHSNNIMFALTFLERRYSQTANVHALAALDSVLNYLDERQDEASGLWQPDDEADIPNAVFAAYHFFPYYFWRGRRPNHADRIIDSTLSIQRADGLFVRNGGACEDLDAVHILVMMSLISDYRSADVQRALERAFRRLLRIQNEDGGFPNRVRSPSRSWKRRLVDRLEPTHVLPRELRQRLAARRVWKYSGWKELSCPVGGSDTWSTWFRPLALKLISERYSATLPQWDGGAYRMIPGLGWHDVRRILTATERISSRSPPQTLAQQHNVAGIQIAD